MAAPIDRLFDAYDTGRLSRRDLLGAIASFVALGSATAGCADDGGDGAGVRAHSDGTADAEAIDPNDLARFVTRRVPGDGRAHLNHVNLRVRDVERSHAYYQRHFGLGLISTPTYHALDCGGGTFLSLQTKALIDLEDFRTAPEAREWAKTPNHPPGTLEHFCLEVDDLDLEATADGLRAEGHEVVEVHGNLLTADPDGILVQVVDSGTQFLHEHGAPDEADA